MKTKGKIDDSNKSMFNQWYSSKSVRMKIISLLKEKLRNNDKTPTVILVSGVRMGGKSQFISELASEIRQICLTNVITNNMSELANLLRGNTDIDEQSFVFIAEEDTTCSTHDDQFIEVDYHLAERGIDDVLCVVVEPSPVIVVHNLRKLKKTMGDGLATYIWENVVIFDHHFCKAALSTFFDTVVERTMKRYERVVKTGRVSVICRNSILYADGIFDNSNNVE